MKFQKFVNKLDWLRWISLINFLDLKRTSAEKCLSISNSRRVPITEIYKAFLFWPKIFSTQIYSFIGQHRHRCRLKVSTDFGLRQEGRKETNPNRCLARLLSLNTLISLLSTYFTVPFEDQLASTHFWIISVTCAHFLFCLFHFFNQSAPKRRNRGGTRTGHLPGLPYALLPAGVVCMYFH